MSTQHRGGQRPREAEASAPAVCTPSTAHSAELGSHWPRTATDTGQACDHGSQLLPSALAPRLSPRGRPECPPRPLPTPLSLPPEPAASCLCSGVSPASAPLPYSHLCSAPSPADLGKGAVDWTCTVLPCRLWLWGAARPGGPAWPPSAGKKPGSPGREASAGGKKAASGSALAFAGCAAWAGDGTSQALGALTFGQSGRQRRPHRAAERKARDAVAQRALPSVSVSAGRPRRGHTWPGGGIGGTWRQEPATQGPRGGGRRL